MPAESRIRPSNRATCAEHPSFCDIRWTRNIALALLLFMVLAVLSASTSGWRYLKQNARLHALRAQAREAGYPVDLEELNDCYPTPTDDDNAAVLIVPYMSELSQMVCGPYRLECATDAYVHPVWPLRPADVAAWESFALEHRDAFDALHAAAERPACRYPIDLSKGSEAPCPSIQLVPAAVRVLLMDAVVRAEREQPDACARDLFSAMRILRTLQEQPQLLPGFAAVTVHTYLCRIYVACLQRARFTDEQLRRFGEEFECGCRRGPLLRAIAVERVIATNIPDDDPTRGSYRNSARPLPAMEAYTAVLLGIVDAPLSRFESICSAIGDWPVLYVPVVAHVQLVAQCRLAQTVTAVERYRLAHGSPPRTLDDLCPRYLPRPPLDPATDQPVQYQLRDAGYTLSSSGASLPRLQLMSLPPNHPARRLTIHMR